MTREEAIKNIKEHCYFANLIPQAKEALDMAIEALKESKTGHWIDHDKHIECDKCNTWFLKDHLIRKTYCPNCGAKMVEPQESEVSE